MEIVKSDHTQQRGIYAKSIPAKRKDLAVAQEMCEFLDQHNGRFNGNYERAFAIAHAQVCDSEEPVRLFVVNEDFVAKPSNESEYFPSRIILNAEILSAPTSIHKELPTREHYKEETTGKMRSRYVAKLKEMSNLIKVEEACMSFPHRTEKIVGRYYRVKVRYQYPVEIFGFTVLRTKKEWVQGLKAHIFQHEIDHFDGLNIYYDR